MIDGDDKHLRGKVVRKRESKQVMTWNFVCYSRTVARERVAAKRSRRLIGAETRLNCKLYVEIIL